MSSRNSPVSCRVAGIDVGTVCHVAVIEGRKIVYAGKLEDCDLEFDLAGIDAPLTLPKNGHFRECERILQKMGIRVLPPKFILGMALRGMEIADELRKKGVRVYEVYPYATRVILNIAPRANKRKVEGRREILKELRRFVDVPHFNDHNVIDAVISALTVRMFVEGWGEIIGGEILIPKPQPPPRLP